MQFTLTKVQEFLQSVNGMLQGTKKGALRTLILLWEIKNDKIVATHKFLCAGIALNTPSKECKLKQMNIERHCVTI